MTNTYYEIYLDEMFFWSTESEDLATEIFSALRYTHTGITISLYRNTFTFIDFDEFTPEGTRELASSVIDDSFVLLDEVTV